MWEDKSAQLRHAAKDPTLSLSLSLRGRLYVRCRDHGCTPTPIARSHVEAAILHKRRARSSYHPRLPSLFCAVKGECSAGPELSASPKQPRLFLAVAGKGSQRLLLLLLFFFFSVHDSSGFKSLDAINESSI